ncbi:MAG: RHS repeat domain-containing protein [Actinomycetota bacterium]|nr:RHS repeat domain-containing protein [Actinomycetota bacterium]
MKFLAVTLGSVVLFAPCASLAQVTQSYSYDANGRLTGVVSTGGAGTHTSTYAYDAAHNRTSRSQTGTTAWAAVAQLPANQFLQPDEALVSPDGRYSFALRSSGQMELWSSDALAASPSQALVAAFDLTDDGQARFLLSLHVKIPAAGAWVSLRDDGQLALLDDAGGEVWRSGDTTGQEATQ